MGKVGNLKREDRPEPWWAVNVVSLGAGVVVGVKWAWKLAALQSLATRRGGRIKCKIGQEHQWMCVGV